MAMIHQDWGSRAGRILRAWSLSAVLILLLAGRAAAGGTLCWRTPDRLVPLPRGRTAIDLHVTGIMVHGEVSQSFHNPTNETIEVIYVFPLPEGAAVDHMEMRIGERRIVSVIQERQEAKKIYAAAKRAGKQAALLDQERPNLFTSSAANIPPGETIEVRLEYIEELTFRGGEFRLTFPLTFTPRFTPPVRPPDDAARVDPPFIKRHDNRGMRASLAVHVQPGLPLAKIESPSHGVQITELDGIWEVRPAQETIPTDRDFLLTWSVASGIEPIAVFLTEERQGERYGLLMLVPPVAGSAAGHGLPTETIFIIDVSGSMKGPSIKQACRALMAALERLRPGDTFNILRFNNSNEFFAEDFVAADDEGAMRSARRWVSALRADGGTMMLPALQRAICKLGVSRSERQQRIIFITDGAISNEDQLFREIQTGLGSARLHTIGIGRAPNAYLVRKMARWGRGSVEYIADLRMAENRIDEVMERINRPVLAGITVTLEGVPIGEAYPDPLPDLYATEPLYLSCKLPEAAGAESLVLQGRVAGGEFSTRVPLRVNGGDESGIAVRWARAKVGSLMDGLNEGADPQEVRTQVIAAAQEFNLVTKYTSLVAVEEEPSADADGGRAVRMPNTLPRGSHQLGLPRGGTLSRLHFLIGLACIGLGLMILSAVKLTRVR